MKKLTIDMHTLCSSLNQSVNNKLW